MPYPFPSEAWLSAFEGVLNSDEQYARVAKNWEGDLVFAIETGSNGEAVNLYVDLWHGKCRRAAVFAAGATDMPAAKFKLRAPLENFRRILNGELDAMQAMMTRKLRVEGNMAYMLRNVPTVLDFVRCARRVGIAD